MQTGPGCGDAGADEDGGVSGVGSGERAGWSAGEAVVARPGHFEAKTATFWAISAMTSAIGRAGSIAVRLVCIF